MDDTALLAFQHDMELRAQAELLLGPGAWSLLQSYGKLMHGPQSGHYVSALSASEQLGLVERLVGGETLDIHLMHRHRSGNYEVSSLRWVDGTLIMVFKDREQAA